MTFGSLFFGIGGFDLGFKWAGMRCIWQSEIDHYAVKIAGKRYPGVKQLGDITKINWHKVERPDVVCGGFPCQNISQAGLREGITGSKSRLWFEYLRCICILRPENVVVENVSALLVRGLDTVLRGLARIGYDAEWGVLSSAGVGKNHQRKRCSFMPTPTAGSPPKNGLRWDEVGGSQARLMLLKHMSLAETKQHRNPEYLEWQMGFPIKWTDLDASETQLIHMWPIESLGQSFKLTP